MMNEQKERYLIKFYNKVSQKSVEDITDIPPQILSFLNNMSYEELIAPFVVDLYKEQKHGSIPRLKIKFRHNRTAYFRRLGERAGVFAPQYKTSR